MCNISWLLRSLFATLLLVTATVAQAAMTVSPSTPVHLGSVTLAPNVASAAYVISIGIADLDPAHNKYVASTNVPWITITPASGAVPGSIAATVTVPATMAAGTHSGIVTIISAIDPSETAEVTLSITVVRAAVTSTSALLVSPSTVDLGTIQIEPDQASSDYVFTVSIAGGPVAVAGGQASQYLASTDAPWLTLSSATGTIPGSLVVTVQIPASMADGTYTGNIRLVSTLDSAISQSLPVAVTVNRSSSATSGQLLVSPLNLNVVAIAEGGGQQTFPVRIASADPASLNFTWSAQTDVSWLSLSQTSGTGNTTLSLTIDPATLMLVGGTDPVPGKVIFNSSLSQTPVELTISVQLVQSTEFAVFPSQIFWTVEKAPDQALSQDAFMAQTIQIHAGAAGWSATHNLGSAASVTGDLVSSSPQGQLTITPAAAVLDSWGYGRYEGSVTIADRLNQFVRLVPVIAEIRRPGETAMLPPPLPEISQISPDYSMVEVVEAGLLSLQLQVPRSLAYYPSQSQCQAAGGSWQNPDGIAGNLDEYCSLNQKAYVLITLPEMFPNQILAWSPKAPEGIMLIGQYGSFLPGADRYSYADGPVPSIPFGPFQLLGYQGTGIVSLRIGPTLAAASEIQRVQVNIRNLSGKWRVTENYDGQSYTYSDANLLNLSLSPTSGSYSGTWGTSPVTVSTGDGGRSHFYRISFSEGGLNYVYEILSLTGGEMKGRWLYSWSGGTSDWETFVGQRVVQPFIR